MKRSKRSVKFSRALAALYRESQCRDCAVVITRMDFAKIMGNFTKVKIQYESASPPKATPRKLPPGKKAKGISTKSVLTTKSTPITKTKKVTPVSRKIAGKPPTPVPSFNSTPNTRLKRNENGMVLIQRNAYNEHPVKDSPKKQTEALRRKSSRNLKENNHIKKPVVKKIAPAKQAKKSKFKEYFLEFQPPKVHIKAKNTVRLADLWPSINKQILPSGDWVMDYYPKNENLRCDKVYNGIAAELDLMCNDKCLSSSKTELTPAESKSDEFPSILDILNDNTSSSTKNAQSSEILSPESKPDFAPSDVEAMLLGQSSTLPMNTSDSSNQENVTTSVTHNNTENTIEEPGSPSILDDVGQNGIANLLTDNSQQSTDAATTQEKVTPESESIETNNNSQKNEVATTANEKVVSTTTAKDVALVVFKKIVNDICHSSVSFNKTLDYTIEIEGKRIELLGAPDNVSSSSDLKVLLEIVDESNLEQSYLSVIQ